MIGLGLTVPIACWRKGAARELWETEDMPPPATCYGSLLSLVGEVDRNRHRGCRVTVGLLNRPWKSRVLRTVWRFKSDDGQGNGPNARPDYQEILIDSHLVIWCDSSDEADPSNGLEARVRQAMMHPETVERFGGWALGSTSHLINDAWLYEDSQPPGPCQTFLTTERGRVTLPVWVDHVGSAGTRYAVGNLERLSAPPPRERLPQIPLKQAS